MKPPLTVWTAPALGGKTRRCIQTCLQEGKQVCLILPSELQAQMARAILLAEGMSHAIAEAVARGFDAFAREVAANAREVHFVPAHLLRWFLQEAVRVVAPSHPFLEPAFRREGMFTLLSAWVREMDREAVSPQILQSLASHSEEPEKLIALAKVWQNYRHLLAQSGWNAEEDVYELAADALRTPTASPSLPRRVLLDGFFRFCNTETSFLRALAQAGCEVVVTLCWDAHRPALFESTSATLQWLERHFEVQHVPLSAPPDESVSPAIAHIARCLFGNPSSTAITRQVPPAVEIWEAPHLLGEMEMVAREIVRLHRNGMAWGEIAVLCRDITSILPIVKAIFEQFGIPTQSFETQVLGEHPVVRALGDLLRLHAEDHPRDGILRWLKSGYLPVDLLEADRLRLRAVRRGVRGGTAEWVRLADEMGQEGSAVAPLLKSLIECTQSLSEASTPQQWLEDLQRGLFNMSLGTSPACADTDSMDVLSQAMEVAKQVTLMLTQVEGGNPTIWAEAVLKAWAVTPRRRMQSLCNAVWLLEATRSRPLNSQVTFVIGMQEGRFPKRTTEDAFLRDEERRWLNAHGDLHLQVTSDVASMERLAFYQSATCARQRVVFTYSRTEADRDVQSSFYLHALRELFPVDGIVQRCLRLNDITAPLSHTLDEADVERTLVDTLFDRNLHTRRPLNEEERWQAAETMKHWLEHHPDRCRQWWRWRYLPDFPRLKAVSPQIGTRAYSATELEELQQCPFRHFVRREMKLRPERIHFTAGQGKWLHAVMHRHRQEPLKPTEQILHEVVRLSPVDRSLGEKQLLIQQVEDMVQSVLEREETIYTQFGLQTLLTEAVFGPAVDEADEPAEDTMPALRMTLPNGHKLQICGRIDRVDIYPQTGAAVLVDYKRDLPDSWWQKVQAGEDFQTVLYTAALKQLWKLKPAAVALDSALDGKRCRVLFVDSADADLLRWLNRLQHEDYGVIQRVNRERWRSIERSAARKIEELLKRLIVGDISPTPGEHCTVCEYRGLCRVVIERGSDLPVHDGEPYPSTNL